MQETYMHLFSTTQNILDNSKKVPEQYLKI